VQELSSVPDYLGFMLDSEDFTLIVFRGTQISAEWILNMESEQRPVVDPRAGVPFGLVHGSFDRMVEDIEPTPDTLAERLDPEKPCDITGHSLGSAIALHDGPELATSGSKIRDRIHIDTFAGPRSATPCSLAISPSRCPTPIAWSTSPIGSPRTAW
jgi:predicted lipase